MAEFLTPKGAYKAPPSDKDGFANMGKPIPAFRRSAAYETCKAMGLTDKDAATTCVGQMAEALERDKPYEAMAAGMKHLDLTGTYRIMAVLLIEPKPRATVTAELGDSA